MSLLSSVPIQRIDDLVTKESEGYVTPKVDVRAAVFKRDKILLVKEKSDGCWTMPGGYADVGLSASQNVEKEVKEEAGITVVAKQLISLKHKAQGNYKPDVRDFYKLFFLCEQTDEVEAKPGLETADVGYFDRDHLPPLSRGRVIEEDLWLAWDFKDNKRQNICFAR